MRAATIFGLGCSPKNLQPFQNDKTVDWRIGMPADCAEVDVILLFGGDGTVHRHLGQLVRLGIPVLVVPAGSGNDFARGLGLLRVKDALAAWQKFCGDRENVHKIDLGIITPLADEDPSSVGGARFFGCVAGVGALTARWPARPTNCRAGCARMADTCSAWPRRFFVSRPCR